MAYIHIGETRGVTVEQARQIDEKVGPWASIDGLLAQAVGSTGDTLFHVSVWQSKAHADRYAAERLMPVFQATGMAADVAANSQFTTFDADELYIR